MPRVSYMIPQQGFRPKTNPIGALAGLRGIGVRGLGQDAASVASFITGQTIGTNAVDPCSTWDFYFNRSKWSACEAAAEAAQIQTVPSNAAYYGYPAKVVAVAQQTANEQAAQAPADVTNIADYSGAGQVLYDPQTQTSLPLWAWIALGFGALVILK